MVLGKYYNALVDSLFIIEDSFISPILKSKAMINQGKAREKLDKVKDYRKPFLRIEPNLSQSYLIDLEKEDDLPYHIQGFKTKYRADVPNAVGYRITCLSNDKSNLSIGFSCDTEYFEGLSSNDRLGNCDILVARISEPDKTEYNILNKSNFKKGHLGYWGTIELIKKCRLWRELTCKKIDEMPR